MLLFLHSVNVRLLLGLLRVKALNRWVFYAIYIFNFAPNDLLYVALQCTTKQKQDESVFRNFHLHHSHPFTFIMQISVLDCNTHIMLFMTFIDILVSVAIMCKSSSIAST